MGNDNKSNISAQQQTIEKLRKQLQLKNKRLNDLKKQNQTLVQQQFVRSKQNKELTVDTLVHMNYSTFTCMNCQNFYDEKQRPPIMVCKNQHNVCEQCHKKLTKQKRSKCLQCSEQFKNLGKNRSVLNLISNKSDLVNWVKQRDIQIQQKLKQAKDQSQLKQKTLIRLCRFPHYETTFEMNNDSLLKISPEDSWHTIRAQQRLPPYQQSEVSFKIIQSVHNSIIVGITTQNQQFQKGFIPSNSIAFHLNNGHIYDQSQAGFKWRGGGTPVAKSTNPSVNMNINLLNRKMKWIINKKVYAETFVPQNFISQPLYVFIAIYHKGDMIVLNK